MKVIHVQILRAVVFIGAVLLLISAIANLFALLVAVTFALAQQFLPDTSVPFPRANEASLWVGIVYLFISIPLGIGLLLTERRLANWERGLHKLERESEAQSG
jgi:hypothetical protein